MKANFRMWLAGSVRGRIRFALLLLTVCGCSTLHAQVGSQRDTVILSPGDTFQLAHDFLLPFSEIIRNEQGGALQPDDYTIEYDGGRLWLAEATPPGRYALFYRYFQEGPEKEVALRKLRIQADSNQLELGVDVFYQDPILEQNQLFLESERIRKSGSLSRGITVGNNRSLSVTSGLRLQLEGDLGDGLQIVGSITDENLPIQPDGTTQEISDFDKVFLRLTKGAISTTVGDYEINRQDSRFARLYRNVQGLQFEVRQPETQARISGAVAKGKFHTNTLAGQEGISGPYRLTGKNGERFFIVLAGSERVYLNGKLMQRGENLDYVIDYNTAEITFTARHVITNITRIVVDFEYNDRYFTRSLVVADLSQSFWDDRLRLKFAYSRDADNPNAPFDDAEAFEQARDSLSRIGDLQGLATTSGVSQLGYDADLPRYEQRDTLINGQTITYYVYSKDSLRAIYGVVFTFVGQGMGSYVQSRAGINDNVFEWVAPDISGSLTGDFAPVRTWVLPQLLQVAELSAQLKISDKWKITHETAVSSEDQNRLSPVGDGDNEDIATRTALSFEQVKLGDSLSLAGSMSHQFIGQKYQNLDRLYQAEYDRIWNLPQTEERLDEQILQGNWQLERSRLWRMRVETGLRQTGPGRTANRQVLSLDSYIPRFLQGTYTLTRIENQDDTLGRKANWLRQEGDLFLPLGKKLRLGNVLWMEQKEEEKAGQRVDGTLAFYDLKPYLRTVNTKSWEMDLSWNIRRDRAYLEGAMRDKSLAQTYYLRTALRPNRAISFQQITAYRLLNVRDTLFYQTGLQDSRVLNTKWEGRIKPRNRLVQANAVYEVSSEQVAQREIRYIQVNPGQGQYVWLDSLFNQDGIQDIEEFQLATNPLVADFIRVEVPTRELFPSSRLSLTANMTWNFRQVIEARQGSLKEWLQRTRLVTYLQIRQNKVRDQSLGGYFLNVVDPFSDSTLLDAAYRFRQDLTFFQNSPVGDIRFSYLDNQVKLFLSTGDEFRRLRFGRSTFRLNLSEKRSLEWENRIGEKTTLAPAFPSRNLDIWYWESFPRFNAQFSRKARLSVGYTYKLKRNEGDAPENMAQVHMHKAIVDAKLNLKGRNNIWTKLELVSLQQTGDPGFSATYELREGLEPGMNAIWQVFATYFILDNLELSLTYDGRASQKNPVIHTGRVQIRALF